ncbi:MAG: type I methionyl aminopeptidase [Myxococcaceae bacterium]|nr:type I methionyl aminopeptidase [Myxococcaceae bacterium]
MKMLTGKRPPAQLPNTNDPCWCDSGQKYKKCHKEADNAYLREERRLLEENRIRKGKVGPQREVPEHIARPEYLKNPGGEPAEGNGRLVRTAEELVRMRKAGAAAAKVLRLAGEAVRPGVTTDQLDAIAHQAAIDLGAYPSPLGYRGFPKSICSSPNEVICHGIPDSRALLDGDIVNLDITVFLNGVHGDTNATFLVGNVDDDSRRLVDVTRECMMRGIKAIKPGRPVSDIGRAIEAHADEHGYGVVRSYCGHAIGDVFHGELQIPHYFDARANTKMEVGMTFTVEPMITMGTFDCYLWDDEWTVVTRDLRRTAQFEHTIVVTETGAEILTKE